MDLKHIIWDWNGTLLNDRWLCVESINKSLKKRNLPLINEEQYLDIFCFPVEDYYKKLGFDFEREPFTITGSEFIENYNSRFHEPDLQEGVIDVLENVHAMGITQSILSAGKQEYVNDWIKYHQLEMYFINVLGIDNHYASGKTVIGKNWVLEMEYDPEEVLMVGDTIHDHEVAQTLGVECVLVAIGHTSLARLQSTGANVLNDLLEFKEYLQELLPVNTSIST
ncbi:MAG TPA: HAD hydrolase-like protein [Candidatus Marinimicrobia bacterium]|jgi:phosphoglycolate phosphatase|nr:phosphatase [Candidatus Neomarinimicrobiota bacterium]MDP6276457.1 HAD hydrolase-like protein [Candidatus Neomarinimicrobiota bacterium]MDP7329730.1 HAD hydrolase-like protein [Candidatus Neomarinimicrobiota bacterium]HJL74727.1 HAD hydrolase-like protein [Candidatus Neomarinimicrobiota bacterium]HJM70253.1 HAD hydrolase-like protein [Candidatus Neomarinimicrobiota bacterium]|tara:strand:- start:1756 stop:2427 length:672 start_codon:yes stop_codon:yes gene_type:complete